MKRRRCTTAIEPAEVHREVVELLQGFRPTLLASAAGTSLGMTRWLLHPEGIIREFGGNLLVLQGFEAFETGDAGEVEVGHLYERLQCPFDQLRRQCKRQVCILGPSVRCRTRQSAVYHPNNRGRVCRKYGRPAGPSLNCRVDGKTVWLRHRSWVEAADYPVPQGWSNLHEAITRCERGATEWISRCADREADSQRVRFRGEFKRGDISNVYLGEPQVWNALPKPRLSPE